MSRLSMLFFSFLILHFAACRSSTSSARKSILRAQQYHKNLVSHIKEIKNTNEARPSSADCMLPGEDIIIFPQQSLSNMSKESMRCFRSHSNPPQIAISGSDSNGNRECWIKSDANCKYACFNSPHSSIAIDSVVNKIQQSPFPNCY